MTTAIAITFALFCVLCAGAVILGLPGIWAMAVAALIVEFTAPEVLTWWTVGGLFVVAVLGELVETLAGSLGAKSRGASKRAMVAAAIGGLVGALLGTVLIPIPVVGTVLGSAIGAGLFAVGFEITLIDRRRLRHLTNVGVATAIGRLFAVVIKGAMAVMAALVAVAAVLYWAIF